MTLKVTRSVDEDQLLLKASKEMIAEIFLGVLAAVRDHVPFDTGNLSGSLEIGGGVTQLEDDKAIVGTSVDYGRKLDVEPQYHYRQHKSFAGKPTQGWFTETVKSLSFGSDAEAEGKAAAEAFWRD